MCLLCNKVNILCFSIRFGRQRCLEEREWLFYCSFNPNFRCLTSCFCPLTVFLDPLDRVSLSFTSRVCVFLHTRLSRTGLLPHLGFRIGSGAAFLHTGLTFTVSAWLLGGFADVTNCLHVSDVTSSCRGATWSLSSSTAACSPTLRGSDPALTAAPLRGNPGPGSVLQQGTEARVALVGVGGAAPVAQRVADVTMGADREAGELLCCQRGGVVRGKREGALTLPQAFGGAEAAGWRRVGPRCVRGGGRGEAQGPRTAPRRSAGLRLHSLDLEPLQLQQPLQVLLQGPHRFGARCASALRVEEHSQLA